MHKIIFAGTTDFGIPALETMKRDFDLALVITQPDKPVGRKKIMSAPPVKLWAIENGVDVIQPEKIADAEAKIREIAPDAMVVAAYGQIIPKKVLELPKHGSINLHSSLLPKYRGASPIQNAILNDDKETGVTLMLMDEKMDHGAILAIHKVAIEETDDYSLLHGKLAEAAGILLEEALPKFFAGQVTPQEQDHTQASYVKMINRDHARIDWTKPARITMQQIKALNPEPGTWTTLDGKSIKILKAEEVRAGKIELPGKIYSDMKDCLVKCGDYSLKLMLVQLEGKNPISGTDFLNGIENSKNQFLI
jgi:methionyl-tRNA formyltransferase